jgi:peptidoglycan pentaglycine glycine transferase (the first glycine)
MTEESWSPLSESEWDAAVLAGNGHFLQSWRWGEFKSRFGWGIERVSVADNTGAALAQILFRSRGPISVGYIPRGPVIPAVHASVSAEMMRNVDQAAKRHRALYTLVESDRPLPFSGTYKRHGFVMGPEHIQPARTVKVALLDDEPLLAQMRQNTRYSVRLAIRRGVEVVRCGDDYDAGDFYTLLLETADRNRFGIHDERYYREFLEIFGDDALCIFARYDDKLAAALIAAKHGTEAIYMYGASSSQHRAHGAAFLLQFEAMKWARGAGCQRYDLWGIPAVDPETMGDTHDTVASSRGDDWRGLYRFKTGFGGDIVSYPPVLERRYSPVGSLVARKFSRRQHGDT